MKKKKMFQQTAAFMMSAIMLTSFTACGRSSETTSTTDASDTTQEDVSVSITAMIRDFNGKDRSSFIDEQYKALTNTNIDWTIVPGSDYDTVLNLKLNSGEFPELIQISKSVANQYSDQGIFVDFSEYLDKMPNYQNWIEKIPSVYNDTATSDGHLYCITNFNTRGQVPRQSILREDILEENNLSVPTTIDELYNTLVKLKEIYPDSTPIVNRWGEGNLVSQVANLYRTSYSFYLDNDTLQYEYGPFTDKFKAAIATLQKFYKSGLIDPEFATASDEQFIERLTTGQGFFTFAEYTCCLNTDAEGNWNAKGKLNDSNFSLIPIGVLDTELGNGLISVQYPTGRGGFSIAINSSSKHIDDIISLIDQQYSDEIINLVNWGVEGKTYTEENGVKNFIVDADERTSLGLDGRTGFWVPIDQDCSDTTLADQDQKFVQEANDNWESFAFYEPLQTLSFSNDEQSEMTQILTPLTTYTDEQLLNFITGKLNMDSDWDNFVSHVKDLGADEILQMYNEKYNALSDDKKGLDKSLGF